MTVIHKQVCHYCKNDAFLVYEEHPGGLSSDGVNLKCSKCGQEEAVWCNNSGDIATGLSNEEKEE